MNAIPLSPVDYIFTGAGRHGWFFNLCGGHTQRSYISCGKRHRDINCSSAWKNL